MKTSKSILVFLAVMMITAISFAAVRTADNNVGAPNDAVHNFSSFGAAYNASSNNDTIYIQGSNTSYGATYLQKTLVIIGTGHGPASFPGKTNTLVSSFTDIHFSGGSSNTKLIGLSIDIIYQDDYCDNVNIIRCKIINRLDGGNWCNCRFPSCNYWIFEGCLFINTGECFGFANSSQSTPVQSTGLILRNNIFAGKVSFASHSSGFQIYNNIFLKTSGADYFYNGGGIIQVYDNIFYSFIPAAANMNAYNNAVYAPVGGTFAGTGNIVYTTTAPFFVNAAPGAFSYSNDYHIIAASPLITGGTSGSQQGVYGGGLVNTFLMSGFPALPNVIQFTTSPSNPTIPYNTPLNVNIVSKKIQ